MKKVKISVFFSILIILAIIAVALALYQIYKPKNINYQNNLVNTAVTTATNTMQIEEKSFVDKNDFYEITAKYPKDSRDKGNVIATFVLNNLKKVQDEWKVGGEAYTGEKQVEKDFPDRPKMVYTYDISYTKHEISNHKIVSYVLNSYQFTGGAHGISFVTTFTFDEKGKLDIEDILDFSNGNGVKLSKILANKILNNQEAISNEDMVMEGLGIVYLKADGTIDKEKCKCDGFYMGSNFQKFYITDEGITFLFDQYQVAPGAAGIVKVDLTWEELKPFLASQEILNIVHS